MQNVGSDFDYFKAFARSIGWISNEELYELKSKHVALGGIGGTGGYYALVLARLGIESFSLADFDYFELSNVNRQAGAFVDTLGKNKAETLAEMLNRINPRIKTRIFNQGVNKNNISSFLEGANIYLNAMGFQSGDVQADIFDACRENNIPAISVIVPGFCASLINFHPQRISFNDYFKIRGLDREEQSIRFIAGHNPRILMLRHYIVSDEPIRFKEYDGPVTPITCVTAAALACTEVLRILLNRKNISWAPWSFQLDTYLKRFYKTWRPGGNSNPLQKFILYYLRRRLNVPKAPLYES